MPLGKRKSDYLKKCQGRVDSAKNFRTKEGLDDLWRRLVDLYRGKHFPTAMGDEDRIAINVAFSTINVISPSVSVNHPSITVAATRPEHDDASVVVEAVINYWWRTKDIQPEFRRAVKDALIIGFGWLKTGYRFVEEEVARHPDDVHAEHAELVDEADAYAEEHPDLAGELPTDDEIAANISTTTMRVVQDRPFVERVSAHDVFVDPEATSPENMTWIAQRIVKTVDEVKNNKGYKASARNKVKNDLTVDDKFRARDQHDRDRAVKRVTVWEYYDIESGTMCVFADGGDDFLVDPMDQPYDFGHPFYMIRNYEVPEHFYPMGELEAIEPLQHELNKTRSQQMNDRKRFARKYLYDPKAFNSAGIAALRSQRDGEYVPVNEGVTLEEAVKPLPQTPLDPSIYAASEQIEGDINTISAVNEYMRGGNQEIRRTATEASIIQDAANSRAADKLAIIEGAISNVARRLVQLAQQYVTEPQVARITGSNGHPHWFEFGSDEIKGEFDFEVEGGSTQPQNEMMRRQQAMQMLTTLAPFADPALGLLNMAEILRHTLQFGFGIKDPSKFMGQGPAMVDPHTGQPLGMPPQDPTGQAGPISEQAPPPADAGSAVPPEILSQLQGQVGLSL